MNIPMLDFFNIKKTVDSVKARYFDLEREISELDRKRNQIALAKTSRTELKQAVDEWVGRAGGRFAEAVQTHMQSHHRTPSAAPRQFGFFSLANDEFSTTDIRLMDDFLCATFGEQIRAAIKGAIDTMPWENEGLPMAERTREIAKIDGVILKKREEMEQIERDAQQAGIKLFDVMVGNA